MATVSAGAMLALTNPPRISIVGSFILCISIGYRPQYLVWDICAASACRPAHYSWRKNSEKCVNKYSILLGDVGIGRVWVPARDVLAPLTQVQLPIQELGDLLVERHAIHHRRERHIMAGTLHGGEIAFHP